MHIAVLKKEVIELLNPMSNRNFIDATVGMAGHSRLILEKTGPSGKLLAIDQDEKAIEESQEKLSKFEKRVIFANSNFATLAQMVRDSDFQRVDGILADLGLGSWQIEDVKYGLSYRKIMPLAPEIEKLINSVSEKDLADILYQYGDVRKSYAVAKRIVFARRKERIKTTEQLRKAIATTWPKILSPIFQALRIKAFDEFENLRALLSQAREILSPGGRLAIISFHSGEDRIVKDTFRRWVKEGGWEILTKKPIVANEEEIKENPRSRSAKLRVIEKIKNVNHKFQ